MNSSLYKYMPDRDTFFDNLLLRASSRSSLNDPFEASPSAEFWADLCMETRHYRFGKNKEDIINYLRKQPDDSVWSELGISLYKEQGIISFTESRDNLLMWAHYAKDHQGMAIEFDTDNEFFHKTHLSDDSNLTGKTTRVLYRKERLSSLTSNIMEPYFHKSDEWSYEKEHRLLLSLSNPCKVLLNHIEFSECITKGQLKENDGVYFDDQLMEIVKHQNKFTFNRNALFMFKVPEEAIKSVTFGCRVRKDFRDAVINKLLINGMGHVYVYQAEKTN